MHFELHSKVRTISSQSFSQVGALVPESSPIQRGQKKKEMQTSKSTKWQCLHAIYALVPKSATLFQENKFLHTEEEAMPVPEWSSVALIMKKADGRKHSLQGGHQLLLTRHITL